MASLRHFTGQVVREWLPTSLARPIRQARAHWKSWRRGVNQRRLLERYGRFTPEMLHSQLLSRGVRKEGVLFVHSRMDAFVTFDGTAMDVLDILFEIVGSNGTLVMPSQPESGADKFDVRRSAASTGLLCELFRRTEGTRRSLHPGQSVCACGPRADELVREHHLDVLGCGQRSPFSKLTEMDAQILGLGLPPLYMTFLHVVEDLDIDNFPCRIYSDRHKTWTVINESGERIGIDIPIRDDRVLLKMDLDRLASRLSSDAHTAFEINGVPCFVGHAPTLLRELKELARNGIVLYR